MARTLCDLVVLLPYFSCCDLRGVSWRVNGGPAHVVVIGRPETMVIVLEVGCQQDACPAAQAPATKLSDSRFVADKLRFEEPTEILADAAGSLGF